MSCASSSSNSRRAVAAFAGSTGAGGGGGTGGSVAGGLPSTSSASRSVICSRKDRGSAGALSLSWDFPLGFVIVILLFQRSLGIHGFIQRNRFDHAAHRFIFHRLSGGFRGFQQQLGCEEGYTYGPLHLL